ncbi:MAG: hypothetical protein MK238_09280 [Nitrospinales bacterium]|nr:hypothetical protein [Nitrospinales bacterium]
METVNNELVKGEIDNVGFSHDEGKMAGFVKPGPLLIWEETSKGEIGGHGCHRV